MSQATTPVDAPARRGRGDHRLVHVGAGLALPVPGPSSPFLPRATEPRRRALALVGALADLGVVQSVVTGTGSGRVPSTLPAGVPVRAVRASRGLPVVPTVQAVRAAAETAGAVHVHLDGHGSVRTVLAACAAVAAPVVVHLAGALSSPMRTGGTSSLLDRVVESQLEVALLRRAELVVVPNAGLAEVAAAAGAARVEVLPPAVLHADALARPASAPPSRRGTGAPLPDVVGPRIVAVGALSRRWDRRGMLDALQARPDVQLVVLGDGSARLSLDGAARERGVVDRVHVLPNVSWRTVERHVAAADVVCSTPFAGEDPAAVLLARAAGRAVVATDVDGLSAAIADGVDGLLVPANDSTGCTDALVTLLDDPATAVELGAAAARRSAARGWSDVAQRLLDLLQPAPSRDGHRTRG